MTDGLPSFTMEGAESTELYRKTLTTNVKSDGKQAYAAFLIIIDRTIAILIM